MTSKYKEGDNLYFCDINAGFKKAHKNYRPIPVRVIKTVLSDDCWYYIIGYVVDDTTKTKSVTADQLYADYEEAKEAMKTVIVDAFSTHFTRVSDAYDKYQGELSALYCLYIDAFRKGISEDSYFIETDTFEKAIPHSVEENIFTPEEIKDAFLETLDKSFRFL